MNLQDIYLRLNLNGDCLIHPSLDSDWKHKVSFPSRLLRLLESNDILKTLDAFFCFDNKPLILFFAGCDDKMALHKAVWNLNESPIIIVIENNAVEIYNGYRLDKESGLLESIGGEEKLSDFSYFELVTGKTWEKYQKELSHKNRVDYHLLKNIEAAQKKLEEDGIEQIVANALLGKVIFIRYLIDRKVRLHFNNTHKYWCNDDLCTLLTDKQKFWSFIQYLEDPEKGFNGDMFKITKEDFNKIPEQSLNWLVRLLRGENISTGQQSLFDLYDFSILPIEFISNVYEKFIGKESQDKNGAYYTPTFIVDYIVAETVGKKLKDSNDYGCKVLDPACGSGIFLVESLRRIIEKYISVNNITNTDTDDFRKVLNDIVRTNIYGIDKDKSAIQVAVFSVYLTLLDYQEPADIENFKFPNLIGTNFICSDTFDVENDNLKVFEKENHKFDYIIGNPPWKRGGIKKGSCCEKYLKRYKLLDKVGNRELAQAFVLRSMDFTSSNTQCALVLVSKILYNLDSENFRKYILDQLYINQVFELAPVRKEVFIKSNDPAVAPACILFYKNANGESTDSNIINHIALKPSRFFTMFKVFSLTHNDIQEIQQDRLKKYDYLWKVLVYGSYLDFIFIKRLKEYSRISDIITSNGYVRKQGLKEKDKDKEFDVSSLVGLNYIKTNRVKKYHIVQDDEKWTLSKVGYVYRETGKIVTDLYKSPILLITGGTKIDLHAVSAISYNDGVFKSSLTGIKGYGIEAISILRNIQAILNSQFFAYYNLLTFSSSGIEREETHDDEKISVPYFDGLDSTIEKIEDLYCQYDAQTMANDALKNQIDLQIASLESSILEKLNCSDTEKDLIDYTEKISIPLATKSRGYEKVFSAIKLNDSWLKDYAQVYIDRFASSFNRNGKRFMVDIHYSEQMIGVFFRVIDEKDFAKEILVSRTDDNLFALATKLSSQRITDQLFVQKDIRGFEKDFFYVIKPNEKRLWHRAIAHLDVNEFDGAMLRAGRNN
ncbi:MAG: N-6 DNA methylase [Bacteroidales bacterium]|nr:N-6 DNA methylase [Bacteroidales bacterium]